MCMLLNGIGPLQKLLLCSLSDCPRLWTNDSMIVDVNPKQLHVHITTDFQKTFSDTNRRWESTPCAAWLVAPAASSFCRTSCRVAFRSSGFDANCLKNTKHLGMSTPEATLASSLVPQRSHPPKMTIMTPNIFVGINPNRSWVTFLLVFGCRYGHACFVWCIPARKMLPVMKIKSTRSRKKHQGPDSKHHFGAFLRAEIRYVATMKALALTWS